jgi:hypothetical protein
MSKQKGMRKERKHKVRAAGLKTRRSFSYTITTKIPVLTVLLLFAQYKCIIDDS